MSQTMESVKEVLFSSTVVLILFVTNPVLAQTKIIHGIQEEFTNFSLACAPGHTGPESRLAWYRPHTRNLTDLAVLPGDEDKISEWNGTAVVEYDTDIYGYKDYKLGGQFILLIKNFTSPTDHADFCCYVGKTNIRCFSIDLLVAPTKLVLTVEPPVLVEGALAVIRCVSDGNPAPYLTWRSPDGLLQKQTAEEKSYGEFKISFITRQHHQAEYECTAVNSKGRSKRSSVQLQVSYVPIVNLTFDNQTKKLYCSTDGHPFNVEFHISQSLDGKTLRSWHNKTELSTFSVDLTPFNMDRTGLYVCNVTIGTGHGDQHFIRPNTAPLLDHNGPVSFFAKLQENGSLRVAFYAHPSHRPTSLRWTKTETNASEENSLYHYEEAADVLVKVAGVLTRISGLSSTLLINQVTAYDMGVYNFSVENSEGEVTLELTLSLEEDLIIPKMILNRSWTVTITLFGCIIFTATFVFGCIAVLKLSGLSVKVAKRRKDRSWWPAKRLSSIYYTWRGKAPDNVDHVSLSKMERDPVYLRPPLIHTNFQRSDRRKPINSVLSVEDLRTGPVPMTNVEEQSEEEPDVISTSNTEESDNPFALDILSPVAHEATTQEIGHISSTYMLTENHERPPLNSIYMSMC